ncbi:hypothetical protein [Rhizobium sp. RU35A]|uniref:hypothetical protein n=1 Tax=Rhizobium sp. RU35A TaxID=1907414 RepID=UPI00122D1510|nr:hypothetical protein [Rhizobium sp. RU35A]
MQAKGPLRRRDAPGKKAGCTNQADGNTDRCRPRNPPTGMGCGWKSRSPQRYPAVIGASLEKPHCDGHFPEDGTDHAAV